MRAEGGGRCAAYCTGESYDLDAIQKFLQDNRFVPSVHDNVIHISYNHDITTGLAFTGQRKEQQPQHLLDLPRFPRWDAPPHW